MAEKERVKIEPDLDFVQDILDGGGEDLKKCFQCGTCSVMCNLAPDDSPFPRQEMIWAQWGLKDKLIDDPNVWTCFQCSDCSAYCPRGASPGDVLGAVRKKVIEGLAFPSFMGKAVADPYYLPFVFGVPALLIGLVILLNGTIVELTSVIQPAHHEVLEGFKYGDLINHWVMNLLFIPLSGLAALAFLVGVNRLWQGASGQSILSFLPKMEIPRMVKAVVGVITDIITHKDFDQCETNKWRKLAHMLVLFSFVGLLVVTALAIAVLFVYEYGHTDIIGKYPLHPLHPIKWIAYLSAAALLAGAWLMMQNRRTAAAEGTMTSSYYDNLFLYIVFGVGLTGILSMLARYLDLKMIGYPLYYVHLVLVFTLLIYSPYSKFAHFVYRTVALIHKRYAELGAEAEAEEEPAAESEAEAA